MGALPPLAIIATNMDCLETGQALKLAIRTQPGENRSQLEVDNNDSAGEVLTLENLTDDALKMLPEFLDRNSNIAGLSQSNRRFRQVCQPWLQTRKEEQIKQYATLLKDTNDTTACVDALNEMKRSLKPEALSLHVDALKRLLVNAYTSENLGVRNAALDVLRKLPFDELLTLLKDEDKHVRYFILGVMAKLEDSRKPLVDANIDTFVSMLKDSDKSVWVAASNVIAKIEISKENLKNKLVDFEVEILLHLYFELWHDAWNVQGAALAKLQELPPGSLDHHVRTIVKNLHGPWFVYYDKSKALVLMKQLILTPAALVEIVKEVLPVLEGGDNMLRAQALIMIRSLIQHRAFDLAADSNSDVKEAVLALLKDKDDYVRKNAVLTLGENTNSLLASDVSALLPLLEDRHVYVRDAVLEVLEKLPYDKLGTDVTDTLERRMQVEGQLRRRKLSVRISEILKKIADEKLRISEENLLVESGTESLGDGDGEGDEMKGGVDGVVEGIKKWWTRNDIFGLLNNSAPTSSSMPSSTTSAEPLSLAPVPETEY